VFDAGMITEAQAILNFQRVSASWQIRGKEVENQ
jgi:hypothetical protein